MEGTKEVVFQTLEELATDVAKMPASRNARTGQKQSKAEALSSALGFGLRPRDFIAIGHAAAHMNMKKSTFGRVAVMRFVADVMALVPEPEPVDELTALRRRVAALEEMYER